MGNKFNKRRSDKEIISEKSLTAVQHLINFLKQNVRSRELFNAVGNDTRVQQIMNDLERGGGGLGRIVEQGWVAEAAAALQYFLAMKLRKPLIPPYIQALALDESPGVCVDIIAHDILGLLRQDVRGRHEILLLSILDLLNNIVKYSPTDELRGCNVPITMLPIFFDMQAHHVQQWRRVAMVFMELIRLAPLYFDIPSERGRSNAENGNNNHNNVLVA